MDSLEKLNAATKVAANKKENVEKAMLSLLAEWNSLQHVDSSAQRLLQDCFTDIQSRQKRLNAVQQSVTSSSKVLDERTKSLQKRLEEIESKEKGFVGMYEEKIKELKLRMKKFNFCKGFIDRRIKDFDLRDQKVDEKKKLVENVFEKFCLEKSEFEKIKGLMEERYEEVKLMEKNIENREIELNRVLVEFDLKVKNVVEKEKELVVKEKSIKNREIKLDRVSVEFDVKMKNMVEKEKELELKERSIETRKNKLDGDLVEFDVKLKNMVEKEKELKLKEKSIENRDIELDGALVEFDLIKKNVEEKEKELEAKEKSIENCDIELDGALVEFDLIKKSVEERERELEANEKSFEIQKIELDRVLVEIDEKTKNVIKKEKELDLKEKELMLIRKLNEKKSKKVESRVESDNDKLFNQDLCREYNSRKGNFNLEKEVINKRVKELETKEKYFKEWVETIDSKEKEIDLKIVSSEERCKELEIMEKKLGDQLKAFELKEKHFEEWVKTIYLKEMEIDSVRILNEERCKKLDSREKNLQDLLNVFIMKEQHLQDRRKSFESKEKEVDSIRISYKERCRKLELEKKKLEDQIKELKVKNKQFSSIDNSIVKPEPWSDDGSYADIRFSITMDGKNLLMYLINHKRDSNSMTDEVYNALRLSKDPAKIVLGAIQDFYVIKEDRKFEEDVVSRCSILLLEQLRRISPQIQSYHKKAVLALASKWKGHMKSYTEVVVFLQLLASYSLWSAFIPEEFSSLLEVIGQQTQITELFQLLGFTDIISDHIEAMLKEKQHVKAIRYVCAFGLHDKFQPAALLKDIVKNALEVSKTLRENISSPVTKKDEAIDNIVASLHEALACIFRYNLESEYPPECIEIFIQQLVQQKEDEKVRLSASNNDAEEQQDAEINCKSNKSSPDPTESCTSWLDDEADDPNFGSKRAMAVILADLDGKSLQLYLNENVEAHGLICDYIFDGIKLSRDSAKLVLDAIQGFHPPHLKMGDKIFKSTTIMRSCILLLEQLMKLSPEIKPQVREDALKLALHWKAKTRTPFQILGFLHLIIAYSLDSNFEPTELLKLFETVSYLPHAPQLCRVIRFSKMTSNHTMNSSSNCHWHHKNSSGLKIQENTNNRASLIQSANSVKLVLGAMRNCYYSKLNSNKSLKSFVVKSFTSLVEKLFKTPQQIQPHVEEDTLKFALDWKTRLVDGRSKKPIEVFGLFHLLAICKVASSVDSNELISLFDRIYVQRNAPDTVRLLGLEHKIPDFIKGLMKKDRLQAIRYIYEFDLVGKFRPVSILKDHICSQNLLPAKIHRKKTSSEPQGKAVRKQLASLRAVVKCIKDHQLEIQYPPDNLLVRIRELEENIKITDIPTKFGRKRDAASSDLGVEAQTQWRKRKHSRIEPLVETSLNVPPAFHSMTNAISCEEAYMQKKIICL